MCERKTSVCVCMCDGVSARKVIKCVWLHRRQLMCMVEASNEGGGEREEARGYG